MHLRSCIRPLQHPALAVVAFLFIIADAALLPFGNHVQEWSLAHGIPRIPNLYPHFFAEDWRPKGWPPSGQCFIVDDNGTLRYVDAESGSFDNWELPLASRLQDIFSISRKDDLEPIGWFSPVALRCTALANVINIKVGTSPTAARLDAVLGLYCENARIRGGDNDFLRSIQARGFATNTIILWRGIANDAAVLFAGAIFIISLAGIPAWRRRRAEASLARQVCPKCRYSLTGLITLTTCPECGTSLRETNTTNRPHV